MRARRTGTQINRSLLPCPIAHGAVRREARCDVSNVRALFVIAAIAATTQMMNTTARAQAPCPPVVTLDAPSGMDNSVEALQWFDLDGSGPEPAQLIAGGRFVRAGATSARFLAAWDGNQWRSMPVAPGSVGLSSATAINHLIVHQGELYALGEGPIDGPNVLVRWTSSGWQDVARAQPLLTGALRFGLSLGEELVIVRSTFNPSEVTIAGLTAGQTRTLGTFVNAGGAARPAAAVVNGQLHFAGSISTLNGQPFSSTVARYDGTAWVPVGALTEPVASLAEIDQRVVVAGRFATPEGPRAMLRWNAASAAWEAFGPAPINQTAGRGDIVVRRGNHTWLSGTGIAASTGMEALRLGTDGTVVQRVVGGQFATIEINGEGVIAGGSFGSLRVPDGPVISRYFNSIAQVDAAGVPAPVGRSPGTLNSLSNSVISPQVRTFHVHEGVPIAGGAFFSAASLTDGHVVRRDAAGVWQPMGSAIRADASNISPVVSDFETFQGTLYVGGTFSIGATRSDLARWNGTEWQSLNANITRGLFNFGVHALTTFENKLVVAGSFTQIAGLPARVAAWDGSAWSSLGSPILLSILDLEVYQESIYAAGDAAGNRGIFRWDGAAWQPAGPGFVSPASAVVDLHTYAGYLYAAGSFGGIQGVPNTGGVARWDGTHWSALPGADRPQQIAVSAMASLANDLLIAGETGSAPPAVYRYSDEAGWRLFDPANADPTHRSGALLVHGESVLIGGVSQILSRPNRTFIRQVQFSTCPAICDSIDFNNDLSFFDPQDIAAFLSVYSEGPCIPAGATCNDIDFNNDTSIFDPQNIAAFLSVYSEGPCL